jgi:predicted dinucleotide-binding enzyme
VAGDDDAAKAQVRQLLESFGWPADRVRDLGGLEAARALETYLPFWLSVMNATGSWMFNIRLVHATNPPEV